MGVFASDQHKPSVRYEGSEQPDDGPPNLAIGANQPTAPFGPEVMELEEDPAIEPDPLVDWRTLYLDYLLRDMCRRTRQKLDGSHVVPSPSFL